MTARPFVLALISGSLLSACGDPGVIARASDPQAGFAYVADGTQRATGAQTIWAQSAEDVAATQARVHALVHCKTIGPETAIQVALTNNRALQAAYAELGLSATDLWEEAMGGAPSLELSLSGIGEVGLARTFEAAVTDAILDLATQKPRTCRNEVSSGATCGLGTNHSPCGGNPHGIG